MRQQLGLMLILLMLHSTGGYAESSRTGSPSTTNYSNYTHNGVNNKIKDDACKEYGCTEEEIIEKGLPVKGTKGKVLEFGFKQAARFKMLKAMLGLARRKLGLDKLKSLDGIKDKLEKIDNKLKQPENLKALKAQTKALETHKSIGGIEEQFETVKAADNSIINQGQEINLDANTDFSFGQKQTPDFNQDEILNNQISENKKKIENLERKKLSEKKTRKLTDREGRLKKRKDDALKDKTDHDNAMAQLEKDGKADKFEKKHKQAELCDFIPLLGEGLTMIRQNSEQSKIANQYKKNRTGDNSGQALSLYAASDSHQERRNTASIQGMSWGAAAACYGFYIATLAPLYSSGMNKKGLRDLIIKAAVSTAATVYYTYKTKNHKDLMLGLRKDARTMFKSGECSPENKTCFCDTHGDLSKASDPETYKKTCEEFENEESPNTLMSFTCVDAAGNIDPQCQCQRAGQCLNSRLNDSLFKGTPTNHQSALLKRSLASLTNGSIREKDLESLSSQLQNTMDNSPLYQAVTEEYFPEMAGERGRSLGSSASPSLTQGGSPTASRANRSAQAPRRKNSSRRKYASYGRRRRGQSSRRPSSQRQKGFDFGKLGFGAKKPQKPKGGLKFVGAENSNFKDLSIREHVPGTGPKEFFRTLSHAYQKTDHYQDTIRNRLAD